jgi:hypothetical protein
MAAWDVWNGGQPLALCEIGEPVNLRMLESRELRTLVRQLWGKQDRYV